MTTSDSLFLQEDKLAAREQRSLELSACSLYWRHKQLLVLRSQPRYPLYFPVSSDTHQIAERLQRSPVHLVRVDAALSESDICTWADACETANKAIYLRVPPATRLPQLSHLWWLKRTMDWGLAVLMLALLSPVMLAIVVLTQIYTPGPVFFKQWRVGQRGKLFKVLKFRTMVVNAEQQHHQVMASQAKGYLHKREDDPRITPLGRWLRRYSLDELPQLLNVLRGEMSLVGPRPWALYDAVRIRPEMRSRLNALPGITGAWQVEARSTLLDLDSVNHRDLEYLHNWSFTGDLKILLQTVPKVLSGFGAY
ncbi:heterocyst development glycosyltransferase HepC [Myxacorys almedinensis]|uniref:Sugar transferase n=1 Tax=Myxacorys almedinensis A TaxID=2690445 RepID=A0A8J8CIK4_9CYAN|nr:heterocyst development glycosyltransferase HepC [Myxacorys almedinensis]NDJ16626.1 sugar transferase [Myxacorys almedinensis A]